MSECFDELESWCKPTEMPMPKCPVCGESDSFEEGERVDVGFGTAMGVKVAPDRCCNCGYVEQGPDPSDLPIEHYIDCWKRKVSPRQKIEMVKKPLDPRYTAWIKANVQGDGYGECRGICASMVRAFPELRRVYGEYMCYVWGPRTHFWCITPDNAVVDPTEAQFPGKTGLYIFDRFYPLEYDAEHELCKYAGSIACA